jgi:N-acyl-D-amino-acid deacylase
MLQILVIVLSALPVLTSRAYERASAAISDTTFSIVITGGLVYDGLGNAAVTTDIGIVGDRIVMLGDLSEARADRVIDATGLAVAPGFIDIHSHAVNESIDRSGIVLRPGAENYVRQGVTTVMGGQDGGSPIDIAATLDRLDSTAIAINVGLFIGHGSIRSNVMGENDRRPTAGELHSMRTLVGRAMDDGAFGLSSGLEYTPGSFAETDELVDLATPVGEAGGLYISHIRDEGGKLLQSIGEVIEVGERAGVAAQITHHKVVGKDRWGMSANSLQLVDEARARGVDVMSDQYPYTASSTGFTILLPKWSREGGNDALLRRLDDPKTYARIRADVIAHIIAERGADPSTIVAARCPDTPEVDGMSLAQMLTLQGRNVTVPAAADIALSLIRKGGCSGVFHSMSELDVERIMQHPMTMISSDGGIPDMSQGVPHPRNYGAFARILAVYVRERHVLTLEEAIRKMTSLPADRLGLHSRGRIEPGSTADIVVFDPTNVQDRAEFGDPHHYAAGVHDLLVSGTAVLESGRMTGALPGRALRNGR